MTVRALLVPVSVETFLELLGSSLIGTFSLRRFNTLGGFGAITGGALGAMISLARSQSAKDN